MRKSGKQKQTIKRSMRTGLFLGILCSLWGCGREKLPAGSVGTGFPTPTANITAGVVSVTPEPVITPTGEPVVTVEPEPTLTPESTAVPTPVISPEPTVTQEPEPTPTPDAEPVVTPEPSPTPEVTPTGGASEEPTPTPDVEPTVTPDAEITPAPTPEVTPDYQELLAGGWQKTDDFFGRREIYFPGRFTETVLYAESGRYEYRYTAADEPEVIFRIIGEEGMAVQLFLDGLVQRGDDCTIWTEGENEYGYTYSEESHTVTGIVYGTGDETADGRMRVEFQCPEDHVQSEEDYFYIK